jgi:hypothetical protein
MFDVRSLGSSTSLHHAPGLNGRDRAIDLHLQRLSATALTGNRQLPQAEADVPSGKAIDLHNRANVNGWRWGVARV